MGSKGPGERPGETSGKRSVEGDGVVCVGVWLTGPGRRDLDGDGVTDCERLAEGDGETDGDGITNSVGKGVGVGINGDGV